MSSVDDLVGGVALSRADWLQEWMDPGAQRTMLGTVALHFLTQLALILRQEESLPSGRSRLILIGL